MNIRPSMLPAPARAGFEVTVADGGVEVRGGRRLAPQAATPHAAAPMVPPAGADLETTSVPPRAANPPRQGATAAGIYGARGRVSPLPPEALNGRLLDVTG